MERSRRTVLFIRAHGSNVTRPADLSIEPVHVLHARKADGCGQNNCIAFDHLRLGTNLENVCDRMHDAGFACDGPL